MRFSDQGLARDQALKEGHLVLLDAGESLLSLPNLIESRVALRPLRSPGRKLLPSLQFTAEPRILSLEFLVLRGHVLPFDTAGQLLHVVGGHRGPDLDIESQAIAY